MGNYLSATRETPAGGRHTSKHLTLFLVATLLLWARASGALDVSACDPVPDRAFAILQNDLSCIGQDLQVGSGATLDLNGFTLTGSVTCASGTCTLTSSGAGGAIVGRVSLFRRIDNVSIDCGGGEVGVVVPGKLIITNASVTNCSSYGLLRVWGPASVRALGLTVSNCGLGVEVSHGRFKGTGVSFTGNAVAAVYSKTTSVVGITATDNGTSPEFDCGGVCAAKNVVIRGGTITGNGAAGVWSTEGKARIRNADLSGNGVDIASARRPSLANSTCATSRMIVDHALTSDSWTVCPGE